MHRSQGIIIMYFLQYKDGMEKQTQQILRVMSADSTACMRWVNENPSLKEQHYKFLITMTILLFLFFPQDITQLNKAWL